MAESNNNHDAQARANVATMIDVLRSQLETLQLMIDQFREQPITPIAFFNLEIQLGACWREAMRQLLEHTLLHLEPATRDETPPRVQFQRETYRRRPKQPKTIYSTFGPIEYSRFRYEACERGESSIFPLDLLLGLEAHLATPALAERVGRLAVDHEQSQVLAILVRDHGVCWAEATVHAWSISPTAVAIHAISGNASCAR